MRSVIERKCSRDRHRMKEKMNEALLCRKIRTSPDNNVASSEQQHARLTISTATSTKMIKRPLLLAAAFLLAVPCFADEETCSEVNTFEKTGECFRNVLQLFKNVTASTGEILQNLEKKLQEKDAQLKRQSDDISALKLKVPSAVGLKGDKGEPGYHGMPGISGLKGEKGEPAPIPLYTSKGVAEKGEKGDHGEEGLPGLPGLDGLPGISGLKGKHGCDDARKP